MREIVPAPRLNPAKRPAPPPRRSRSTLDPESTRPYASPSTCPTDMPGSSSEGDVTRLVRTFGKARDDELAAALLPQIVETLRHIAHGQLAREREGRTLDTVGLVNEAYIKLNGSAEDWESRAHFYGSAARAMRQVLVSYARSRNAEKRGGGSVEEWREST